MPHERDVEAFDIRARRYEGDWRGRLHSDIVSRTLDLALQEGLQPQRVLDVGCGTGQLLRRLAAGQDGDCGELVGVDASPGLIKEARSRADDPRLVFLQGEAERLPFPENHFELVFATTSFDHWADQRLGLRECARVLAPGGRFILTDLFSMWLLPTLLLARRGRVRTKRRVTSLLQAAGLTVVRSEPVYRPLLATIVATK